MSDKILWIDLQTTGLNPDKHNILEVSTALTNRDIDKEFFRLTSVVQAVAGANFMTWDQNFRHRHEKSGLVNAVDNDSAMPANELDDMLLVNLEDFCEVNPAIGGIGIENHLSFIKNELSGVYEKLSKDRTVDLKDVQKQAEENKFDMKLPNVEARAGNNIDNYMNYYKEFKKRLRE